MTRHEYAATLVAHPADCERIDDLLAHALATAETLGMPLVCRRIETVRADVTRLAAQRAGQSESPLPPQTGAKRQDVFQREGEYWTIVYRGTAVHLRDTKGLHYIAHLLAHPR